MAWAALAKGLVKREAKAMGTKAVVDRGKKMLGDRRKKVGARREAAQKMMGQEGEETSAASPQVGGVLATVPLSTSVSSIQQHTGGGVEEGGTETLEGSLIKIKSSVISVDSLLKGTYTLQQKQLADQKQAAEKVERKGDEADLEKGKKKGPGVGKLVPKKVKSFWQGLLDFFTGVILGWVAVRMLKFLPALKKFLPIIAGAIDGIVNTAMFLFEGFTTLVDWGYQLVALGEKAVKGIFGEEGAKKYGILMTNLKNLVAGFLVWKIIGKQIFETIVRNIKFVWAVAKAAIQFAAQAINWMTRGAAGNLAKGAWQGVKGLAGKGISAIGSKIGGTGAGKVGSSILKHGIGRAAKRASIRFFGKGVTKAFGKIPIIGPLIVGIVSLMSGEPLGQALFKTFGAAIGGLLGTFIPIPYVGTILGEAVGVFVGDLLYHLIVKRDPQAAFKMLKDTVMGIFKGGKAIFDWITGGFGRFYEGIPKIKIPDFPEDPPGIMSKVPFAGRVWKGLKVSMKVMLGPIGLLMGKEIPNLLWMMLPTNTVPLLFKSFFPPGGEDKGSSTPATISSNSSAGGGSVNDLKEKKKEEEKQKAIIGKTLEGAKKTGGNLMGGVKSMFAPEKEVVVSSHSHRKGAIQKLVEGPRPVITEDMTIKQQMVVQRKQKLWDMGQSARGPSIVKSGPSDNKLKSLESYASYEDGGQEGNTFIQIPIPVPMPSPTGGTQAADSDVPISDGGGKALSPFMALYRGDG